MLVLGLLLTGFVFCRYRPWSMLLHHTHAACLLHHSHEMLHGSHKTLHFLHETILAQFSYETVYMVWNTLNSFIRIILLYSILWTRCDMMIFYCHHTCQFIELTIYSQIVNNACMFTYSFKTNVSINLSIIRSTDVVASKGVIVFVNFCFIFILYKTQHMWLKIHSTHIICNSF